MTLTLDFMLRVWNSLISGMGWPIDMERKRMWVIHSWPWYWVLWPWWGGWMCRIVTGMTSDVGVLSTYLVIFIILISMFVIILVRNGIHTCHGLVPDCSNSIANTLELLQSCINSLGPSDAIWRHRSGSTLAQVMACCLTAPSHYLNQCWLIISKVRSSDAHLRASSLVIPQPSITEIL